MSLGGEQMPNRVTLDNVRRLAEHSHADPETAVDAVRATLDGLRQSWRSAGIAEEARSRLPVLAVHYEQRLADLPLSRV